MYIALYGTSPPQTRCGSPLFWNVILERINTMNSMKTYLGIEFGSTRIKAILIDEDSRVVASGAHDWENRLENGIWTYTLEDIRLGLQDAYATLAKDYADKYGEQLTKIGGMGFSAMMHGYMAFNANGELLVPFRTWRNTITGEASAKLSELFGFNIPQRWSIAHLYQAILNKEEHVSEISYVLTLAGYIHYMLTGKRVLGVGEASGMFPIDSETGKFDAGMIAKFDELIKPCGFSWNLESVLPGVLNAGEAAGTLTEEGAKFIDPTGTLQAGIPVCPPEGDAGTGMVATNSVRVKTGNVSAGTSVFAMIVLDKPLSKLYPEIDMVTTPSGKPVAMVHCNNCSTDLDAWMRIFSEFAELSGHPIKKPALYDMLLMNAMNGDPDCGGMVSCNYFSGEHITHFEEGRPMLLRTPDSNFTLANLIRNNLFSALSTLKIGLDILMAENVEIDSILGHGGYFKTKGVGQKLLAAAMNTPVSVMETAGEGGAWGMAVLAQYMVLGADQTLEDYLDSRVFADMKAVTEAPDKKDVDGFNAYIERYRRMLAAEKAAVENF